jgi:undecaprenyl-diphosphatase
MLAAGGYEILEGLRHPAAVAQPEHWSMVALGLAVSAIVSFAAVKWLLRFVQTHTFNAFGWYRVALGGLLLVLGLR